MSALQHAYEAAVERMPDGRVRWRSLGTLYVAGGLLGLLSLALPHAAAVDASLVGTVAGSALVTGLLMLLGRPLLADVWVFVFLIIGSFLVSAAVYGSHELTSPYAFFYVWVAFQAFFFLPVRAAALALAVAAAAYAVALALIQDPAPGEAGRWLITLGTAGVVGGLAGVLRERSDRLIARLGRAAQTDPLTGLLNRRGFQAFLESHAGRPMTLVVADLDHFKALNDRFGHHVGDAVLRRWGQVLANVAPRGAVAARTGGEEFAIVLPGANARAGWVLAELLRRRTREGNGPRGMQLTVSLGVAAAPEHADGVEELLRVADKALYLAKQLGRDRTVVYSPEAQNAGEVRAGQTIRAEQAAAVLVLAEALDVRDGGTAAHSRTVGRYAELIARQLGLPGSRVDRIRLAGVLHDIGKIGLPDSILRKPGPLDADEWLEIRKHPELGARILAGAGLEDVATWVVAHHERLDGEGYPAGLTGEDIPLEARILAVADSYEAMTAERVYRAPRSHAEAAAELARGAGAQFDGDVVQALLVALELPAADSAAAPRRARAS